jgi:hypothetical protein
MRKTITAVLAVALVAGAFMAPAADAKKKKKAKPRVVTDTYDAPAIGAATPVVSGGASGCTGGNNIGCVEFATSSKDKYVKIEVTDQSGQKAGGYLSQGDTDGDGVGNLFGDFCGAHLAPVPITPGVPLKVSLYNGTCADGSPSTVTTGTVKGTFTVK